MFSAVTELISGNIIFGFLMLFIVAFFAAAYIFLTRNGSGYTTNLCIVGCILCGITVDVIWSLFSFGETPLIGVSGSSPSFTKLFFEFMTAGVIFFSGLIITNIVKVKRFTAVKLTLFIIFAAVMIMLLINLVSIRFIRFKIVLPGFSFLATNIVLISLAVILVCVLGILAISGRGTRSRANTATIVVLVTIALLAGATGIYKCIKDGGESFNAAYEKSVERTDTYNIIP